jgi:eukaryotic-like serine/threonine-protein kinase
MAQMEMSLEPDSTFAYQDLSSAYFAQNRLEEARSLAEQAATKGLDSVGTRATLLLLAYMRHDPAAAEHQFAPVKGKSEEAFLLRFKGDEELRQGRIKQARETFAQASAISQKNGVSEFAAFVEGSAAVSFAVLGNCTSGREGGLKSLQTYPNGANRTVANLALALCGEEAKARKGMEALAKERPDDTYIQSRDVPLFRAIAALQHKNYEDAFVALEPARPFDLGTGPLVDVPFGVPYVRGLANLGKKDGQKAVQDFTEILDHREIYAVSPLLPLARLQLARAYVVQGDTAKARAAYQECLATWKEADPDLPAFVQAKAEYAKLN